MFLLVINEFNIGCKSLLVDKDQLLKVPSRAELLASIDRIREFSSRL